MPPIKVPADFSAATTDELNQVRVDASKAAQPLIALGLATISPEQRITVRELAQFAAQAQAEIDKRAAAEAEFAADAATFAAIEASAVTETASAEPATPAVEAAPAETVTATPAVPATTFAANGKSGSTTATLPRARDIAGAGAQVDVSSVGGGDGAMLTYGSLVYDGKTGLTEFTGLKQLGQALVKRIEGYGRPSGSGHDTLIEFRRDFPETLRGPAEGTGGGGFQEFEFGLLDNASQAYASLFKDQTAAAAYCAPSLTLYELCELETTDGILPMTEVQISRGGIWFTTGPDFASIFNGAGYWNYTEAQVISGTVKPCMEIPCPPFEEQRLRNLGVCITAGILQRRGYPELIARFIRGAMIAHLHRINAFVLAQMAAGSTLVDFDPIPVGSLVGDSTSSGLLAAAEMVAVDIRYRNRLAIDANLEAVFPVWALAQLRADVSRRTGVDMISVSDSDIVGWFTDRHITLRLVYDWQDAYSGVAAGPGAALPGITTFPLVVEFMIYPPGTWVKGVDDTIRLETVYDSAKLSTNQYTALFTEEGVLIAKVCPDSRRVVYPLCPTGATAETVARTCA
jgi:hypothetical protein